MSRFYIYETRTGKKLSNNLISYADRLPVGTSEVEITTASRYHTVWDNVISPRDSVLLDNGGGRVRANLEIYTDFERDILHAYNGYSASEKAAIVSEAPGDIKAVIVR